MYGCTRSTNPLSPDSSFSYNELVQYDLSIHHSSIKEVIPDAIAADNGGIQNKPKPEGKPYYYNSDHTAAESDIQMDSCVYGSQTVIRYLRVSGIAIPDDSGYTDRYYHAVNFRAKHKESGVYESYSIPVDNGNQFSGYLYFRQTGTYQIYAYRAMDYQLYPNMPSASSVDPGYATVYFTVTAAEAVPANLIHLLPTRNIDCGTKTLREYAAAIAGVNDNITQVKNIYEFLINGDNSGTFTYSVYNSIFSDLSISYESIFIASHFLARRKGVCNDFAELFAAMTRSLGFAVLYVSGDHCTSTSTNGHSWNKIQIDGIWYNVDATWANTTKNSWKYAQFYPGFDAAVFNNEHAAYFSQNFSERY
ncbi:MAG: hypothetical protein A2096_04945 [Spirochaetes bacterium GWF1_41_5]|nr:MAG: hypothetical protein A2096_04945 [Spirochaetes bacterium GWF1_41_5]HBE02288.1 hypothetical protein [Spirochaetia bacterium]